MEHRSEAGKRTRDSRRVTAANFVGIPKPTGFRFAVGDGQ
jgi:hypothetical protein